MSIWTAHLVEQRLEEAAATLRRLPSIKVRGYFNTWPQVLHDTADRRDWEKMVARLGPPSARAISRMEETLTWCRLLPAEDNRLVWARANGMGWKTLSWRMGCNRATAWRRWVAALATIAIGLNKK